MGKDPAPGDVLEFGERGWLSLGGEEEKHHPVAQKHCHLAQRAKLKL